jgi:hypothetical protein
VHVWLKGLVYLAGIFTEIKELNHFKVNLSKLPQKKWSQIFITQITALEDMSWKVVKHMNKPSGYIK